MALISHCYAYVPANVRHRHGIAPGWLSARVGLGDATATPDGALGSRAGALFEVLMNSDFKGYVRARPTLQRLYSH
jgi:hypothetical protein